MIVYVDLPEGETREKLIQAISLCSGIPTSDENIADIYLGDSVHPLLETVIVSSEPPRSLENVIDVILPNQTLEYYIMKIRLVHCYVYSKCSVQGFLNEELYKSQRYGIPSSVILIQILSDSILATQTVYKYARNQMRISDKVILLQPGSLLVFLPYTSVEGAKIFATRLLRRVERSKVKGLAAFPDVIFSICQVDNQTNDSADLLFRLEQAGQKALQIGRKIVLA